MYQLTLLLTIILFTIANLLTSYLYLYPIFHGCSFPSPPAPFSPEEYKQRFASPPPQSAPFRLLLLGDPQLEGSTSLVSPSYSYFPSLRTLYGDVLAAPTAQEQLHTAQSHLQDLWHADIPVALQSWRKQVDLFGNDFYLAHIYRTLFWFTHPTHVAVLGDLLGSQWIDDAEFESRGERFWGRVFSGGRKVGEEITNVNADAGDETAGGHGSSSSSSVVTTRLGDNETDEAWKNRVINVAGNHDVGYAGDMTSDQVQRFERVFGKVNWETRFTMPVAGPLWENRSAPELRLVVLNSLNIDSPAGDAQMQTETFDFMNRMGEGSSSPDDGLRATILLTHLPLHKEERVCVDGPMIRYADEEDGGSVIREQNHLSSNSSAELLKTFYKLNMGRIFTSPPLPKWGSTGIIFTGHDHEGCDVYHQWPIYEEDDPASWQPAAEKWNASSAERHASDPGVREVTVRSMMGEFSGNAGLLSAWFDAESDTWEFEYANCALGKQHLWWAVHVLDIIALVMCIYTGVKLTGEALRSEEGVTDEKKTQ